MAEPPSPPRDSAELWRSIVGPWSSWLALAPQNLHQPINPGWAFGNLTINAQNSRAPDVEQAIASKVSYGRQIGRMMEAMEVLVTALPKDKRSDARVKEFEALAAQVKQIKSDAGRSRLDRLREDLQALKRDDETAWKELMKALR